MKFDKQSLFVGLVIGVIVGGIVIGLVDTNRPQPLFSSADGGRSNPYAPCDWQEANYRQYYTNYTGTPGYSADVEYQLYENWHNCLRVVNQSFGPIVPMNE